MRTNWIEDYNEFCKKQWEDFDYKLPGGESLNEVQERVVRALENVLQEYNGQNLVIGIHGTALAVLLNHFDSSFGYERFKEMTMPWIIDLTFEGKK